LRKKPRRLGRHASLAANELVDSLQRNTDVFCKADLGDAQRDKELLAKDLTRMRGNTVPGLHS
jgi:hypothetical protein